VNPGAGDMTVTERIEMAKKNAAGNNKFSNTDSGYEIDHVAKTIRTSFNDRNALREAADKFMAYDMEGLGYTFEAYCADGSCRTYSNFSDLYKDISPNTPFDLHVNLQVAGEKDGPERALFFDAQAIIDPLQGKSNVNIHTGVVEKKINLFKKDSLSVDVNLQGMTATGLIGWDGSRRGVDADISIVKGSLTFSPIINDTYYNITFEGRIGAGLSALAGKDGIKYGYGYGVGGSIDFTMSK